MQTGPANSHRARHRKKRHAPPKKDLGSLKKYLRDTYETPPTPFNIYTNLSSDPALLNSMLEYAFELEKPKKESDYEYRLAHSTSRKIEKLRPSAQLNLLTHLAIFFALKGDFAECEKSLSHLSAIFKDGYSPRFEALVQFSTGKMLSEQQTPDYPAAIIALNAAKKQFHTQKQPTWELYCLTLLIGIHAQQCNLSEIHRLKKNAEKLFKHDENSTCQSMIHYFIGKMKISSGQDFDGALVDLKKSQSCLNNFLIEIGFNKKVVQSISNTREKIENIQNTERENADTAALAAKFKTLGIRDGDPLFTLELYLGETFQEYTELNRGKFEGKKIKCLTQYGLTKTSTFNEDGAVVKTYESSEQPDAQMITTKRYTAKI